MNVTKAKSSSGDYSGSIGKVLVIYCCILVLAGVQFVIAYQHLDTRATFVRMLLVALLEAGFAVLFFMHLGSEDRKFRFGVAFFVIFILAAMQYGWTDSFRMGRGGAPGSGYGAESSR
jgi:heme/copper-type cytochrome/quinol oxidase subunit 4